MKLFFASGIEAQIIALHFQSELQYVQMILAHGTLSHLIIECDIPPGQSVTGELYLCADIDGTPQNNCMWVYLTGI